MFQRRPVTGRRRNGEEFRAEVSISKINVGGEVEMVAIIRDANEAAHMLAELQVRASTDYLTQVPNRWAFMRALEAEHARSQRYAHALSVLVIDVDHFKAVNDTYGHATGDRLLKAIGAAIGGVLRGTDMVGRYGGEEFAVMLTETTAEAALGAAERVRAAANVSIDGPEAPITATVSVGIATLRERETVEDLLVRADAAMYDAKSLGRNRVAAARF
jgi:diguanylate cyclase (GGDEF)-like protein